MIFNENKRNRKWNCHILISINKSNESFVEDASEINIIDKVQPIKYDWNCETSMRFKNQKGLVEKDYVLLYE